MTSRVAALLLGGAIALGLVAMGFVVGKAAIGVKQLDRVVTVKGLSEREVPANVVIWPIQFVEVANDLPTLYAVLEGNVGNIRQFLLDRGISEAEITNERPLIIDKTAQQYGGGPRPEFRYSANQTVTVYSEKIEIVRKLMGEMSELGKQGIVFSGDYYQSQTEYLFTGLNEIKPAMVEEATREARAVAEKFAADSDSVLGKIRTASQGQFSITERDKNNPHIKKVRVVSTIEYYLSD